VYLPLHWKTPRLSPPTRNYLPIDAVAHRTIPFTQGLSRMPMINSHLVTLPPAYYPSGNSLHNYARGICHHKGEHISEPKLPK